MFSIVMVYRLMLKRREIFRTENQSKSDLSLQATIALNEHRSKANIALKRKAIVVCFTNNLPLHGRSNFNMFPSLDSERGKACYKGKHRCQFDNDSKNDLANSDNTYRSTCQNTCQNTCRMMIASIATPTDEEASMC